MCTLEAPPTVFLAISHTLTFLVLQFFPKEVQGRDVPYGLSFLLWGYTLSCAPWPDLSARISLSLYSAIRMTYTYGGLSLYCSLGPQGIIATIPTFRSHSISGLPPISHRIIPISCGKSTILMGKDGTPHTL